MRKAITSAAVCLTLSAMFALPAMANKSMSNTDIERSQSSIYGSGSNMNGTPGATGTPDVYGIPGTPRITPNLRDLNNASTYSTRNYSNYGSNTNGNNMNSYYGSTNANNGSMRPYGTLTNRTITGGSGLMRDNSYRATAVGTDDDGFDWGWLGLLGLLGLVGMRNRSGERT
ncbi:WGxxGxxG family protein [Paenibacillus lignilyticus]